MSAAAVFTVPQYFANKSGKKQRQVLKRVEQGSYSKGSSPSEHFQMFRL
jgi:hypothetical protein